MANLSARADVLSGVGFLALGTAMSVGAVRLTVGTPLSPGPGFYPLVLGVGLGITAVVLIVSGVRRRHRTPHGDPSPSTMRPMLVLAVVSLLMYPVLLTYLGYPLATFLFLVLIFRAVEMNEWTVALPLALAFTACAYAVFGYALRIPFPRGLFG